MPHRRLREIRENLLLLEHVLIEFDLVQPSVRLPTLRKQESDQQLPIAQDHPVRAPVVDVGGRTSSGNDL